MELAQNLVAVILHASGIVELVGTGGWVAKRRPSDVNDVVTWMEIADGPLAELEAGNLHRHPHPTCRDVDVTLIHQGRYSSLT